MRTVSFSDKRVATQVNSKFVAAWVNRGPGFLNTEFWTETGIVQNHYEAYPTKNICTFFATPDGKVFFYAAGSYAPELFLKILNTAWSLRQALFDGQMAPLDGGLAKATRIHEDLADTYEEALAKVKRASQDGDSWRSLLSGFRPGDYRGLKHTHGPGCLWSLQEGDQYLAGLHRLWAGTGEFPALADVRYRYFYGNEFTEETPDSPHISKAEPPPVSPATPRPPKTAQIEPQRLRDLLGLGLFGPKPGDH